MIGDVDAIRAIRQIIVGLGIPKNIEQAIVQIVLNTADPKKLESQQKSQKNVPETLAGIARHFHSVALKRQDIIGRNMINDAAWHMLLALYADCEEDRPVSVTSLVQASGSPPTTALRYLSVMEDAGMITRRDHPSDGRSSLIAPTNTTIETMREVVVRFCVPRSDLPVAT